ncbi:MAG: SPOR domain-containing protein [Acetobacteraceae bacterium]
MSDDVANRGPTYRVPRSGMDPASKRLALIAAGLGGALFVVLGVWSTLGGGHSGAVPVIAPPAGPMRVRPDNPGGLKVANDLILSGGLSDVGTDKLAPAPEAPDPQALKVPRAPRLAPPPAPVVAKPPAPALPPPPAKPVAAATPAAHAVQVQLAALPTREAAEVEWRIRAKRNASLLNGRTASFTDGTVNGQVWWRVRTGGFTDEAQARAFCEKLRAAGSACSVVRS